MNTANPATPHVFAAINAVQTALAKEGITKDRKNQQQSYNFRGIDDVYNALCGLLAEHSLCILPSFTERTLVERESGQGKALFYVTLRGEFTLVSSKDGSSTKVSTYGEAMDSADKATNKAMSAAYKYACLQAFCIPTEGDNDADATTHEPVSRRQAQPQQRQDPLAGANRAVQVPGDWRECVVHFGKNKDVKLGDLPDRTLRWYINEWQPKPYGQANRISDADAVLRQMLDKAGAELAAGKQAVADDHAEAAAAAAKRTTRQPAPAAAPAAAADADEVPF